MSYDPAVYLGLFLSAFLAATLLPAQSEIALGALIVAGGQPVWALLAAAALGNILGSCLNWLMGTGLARLGHRKWFPVDPQSLARATGWYRRWGRFSLLLSWAPVIGDPLTLAAGFLREPFLSFLMIVAVAKTARYAVVAAIVL